MNNSIYACSFAALIIASATVSFADTGQPARIAANIAPFVNDRPVLIIHVDLQQGDFPAALGRLASAVKSPLPTGIAAATYWGAWVEMATQLQANHARDLYGITELTGELSIDPTWIVPIHNGADVAALESVLTADGKSKTALLREAIVAGKSAALEELRTMKPAARPEMAAAFATVPETTVQVLLLPTDETRRIVEETLPTLPKVLGGGPSQVFTQGVLWGAIGLDLRPRSLGIRCVAQSANPEAAAALKSALIESLERAVPKLADGLKLVAPQVVGDRLVIDVREENGGLAGLAAFLAPPLQAARDRATRAESMNNLKLIMLAAHNYFGVHKKFPPRASYSAEGKPLLSWRVQLLPYLDQEKLYKEFKLDEPWDSEHNRALIARMPDVYRTGADHRTSYLAPILPAGIFGAPDTLTLRQITDGTSKTIMFVEADRDHAVTWTKPDDIEIDAEDPARGLRDSSAGGFVTAFADGSAHFISNDVDPKTLHAVFTATGGETVRLP